MSLLLRCAIAVSVVAVLSPVAAAPEAATPVGAFDPASLTPYFVDGPLAKASERLRSGDPVSYTHLEPLW